MCSITGDGFLIVWCPVWLILNLLHITSNIFTSVEKEPSESILPCHQHYSLYDGKKNIKENLIFVNKSSNKIGFNENSNLSPC